MPTRLLPTGALAVILIISNLGHSATGSPRVVASIAPLHSLVAAVMSGRGQPQLLLRGGESPHSFSLRPSDARKLHGADLLFWIGPALETPLSRLLPNLGVGRAIAMIETPGLHALPRRDLQAETAAAGNPEGDHEHAGDHAGLDPHIWLSPANAAVMADHIAQVLARHDPSGTERYRANARQLKDRLAVLDSDLRQQLSGIRGSYIVFHDAYHYLEDAYALQPVAAVTTHPERKPGAAHLRQLRAVLTNRQVRCLFSEPQFQPRLVAMLGEGLAVRHAILDPLGAEFRPGPDAYPQMMRKLAATMAACMRGEETP